VVVTSGGLPPLDSGADSRGRGQAGHRRNEPSRITCALLTLVVHVVVTSALDASVKSWSQSSKQTNDPDITSSENRVELRAARGRGTNVRKSLSCTLSMGPSMTSLSRPDAIISLPRPFSTLANSARVQGSSRSLQFAFHWSGTAQVQSVVPSGPASAPMEQPTGAKWRWLSAAAKSRAIEELKRRGREAWGATYYSQMASPELCRIAGRPREVQYGALIGWIKRLGRAGRSDPSCAFELVAHLLGVPPSDQELITNVPSSGVSMERRASTRRIDPFDEAFAVNCPRLVHDHRFVVLGELPWEHLHPAVVLQPQDGSGFWYPQAARHNPLRAGRAFCCFVRFGNPGGIWHAKKLPLDAKVRAFALDSEWKPDWTERMGESELGQRLQELRVVAEKDFFVTRASTQLLEPTLRDHGRFEDSPLVFNEPRAESCRAPVTLGWNGGAAYIEIREGSGDRLVHAGTAASGATLVVRGVTSTPPDAATVLELDKPGQYRLRLYPTVWSFVDPPYEWWLDIT